VAGQRHRVHAGRREVDRHLPDRLDRVGVHRDAVLTRDRDDRLDRLHAADLVVGPHHRHQRDARRVCLHGGPERVQVDPAEPVDRGQHDLGTTLLVQPVQRVENGVVLDGRADDPGTAWVLGVA
jgi:hypothetical protein